MVFTVALYVPRCRHLVSLPDVQPQLYADNLKCFDCARFTVRYVRSVCQEFSPVRAGWSMSLFCRSSWFPGAVVKETAEISQLLLLRNRWLPLVLAALLVALG